MNGLDLAPLGGWLVTFALHSTIALGAAWTASVLLGSRLLALQETLLRWSIWAGLVSATVQCAVLGSPWCPQQLFGVAEDAPSLGPVPESLLAAVVDVPPAALDGVEFADVVRSPYDLVVAGAAIATLCGLVWLARVQWRLRRLLSDRRPESCPRVLTTAAEVAQRAGLQQSPQLSRSLSLRTPIAFGLLRPEICLPERVPELGTEPLRAMLAHEVAHLRGHDPAWMWAAAWLQAIFPWQVLLVAVRRRWARLIELRCDAVAGEQAGSTAVARCLLEVASWLQQPATPLLALGMAQRPSALRERIEAALQGAPAARSSRRASAACGGLVVGALTFGAPGAAAGDLVSPADAVAGLLAVAPADAATLPGIELPSSTLLSLAEQLRVEQEVLIAEARRLRADLRTRRLSSELQALQQQLESRLSALQRLQARLQAVLSRSGSR